MEQAALPRAETWDALLAATGAPGIHFEDHPQLRGYELPEWSHLSATDAESWTTALVPLAEAAFRQPPTAGSAPPGGRAVPQRRSRTR